MSRRIFNIFAIALMTAAMTGTLQAQGRPRGGQAPGSFHGRQARPAPPPRSTFGSAPRIIRPPVVGPQIVAPGINGPGIVPPRVIIPPVVSPSVIQPPINGPRIIDRRPGFGFSRGIFPSPVIGGPFFSSYPFYPYPYVYTEPYMTQPAYESPAYSPVVTQNETDLTNQVQQLSREVEQLRESIASSQAPQPAAAPPPQPETPSQPVILVFRDGHRMEVQNYAIVDQTLWVLDRNSAAKIPLSDLNLAATENLNRSRGVPFRPPTQ